LLTREEVIITLVILKPRREVINILNIREKCFTLVELLVVVTLIAILAVAVLATLNPMEQRRKAIDVTARNAAGEFIRAEERFNATYGCYTWEMTDSTTFECTDLGDDPAGETNFGTGALDPLLTVMLTTSSEVKQSLLDDINQSTDPWATVALTEDPGTGELHVCFVPESQSYTQIADCDIDATCPGVAGGGYVCSPDTSFGG
jgi:type II secretory pathway pseudopilin PulG